MQNLLVGLEFACREQDDQTLPSNPHGIAGRLVQDICHFSIDLVILLTGVHLLSGVTYNQLMLTYRLILIFVLKPKGDCENLH